MHIYGREVMCAMVLFFLRLHSFFFEMQTTVREITYMKLHHNEKGEGKGCAKPLQANCTLAAIVRQDLARRLKGYDALRLTIVGKRDK